MANGAEAVEEALAGGPGVPISEEVEVVPPPEETLPPQTEGTLLKHTADEIPELSGKAVGDVITLEVTDITDDGVYGLGVMAEEPVVKEGLPPGGAPIGQEAVEDALLG